MRCLDNDSKIDTFNQWRERIPALHDWTTAQLQEVRDDWYAHIESMAIAYLLHTGLMPDEVELVEQRDDDEVRWYYRRR